MRKSLLSIFAMAALMAVTAVGHAQSTYTRILSTSELEVGTQYLLVGFNNDGAPFAMGYQKTNNRHAVPIEMVGDDITTVVAMDPNDQEHPFEFTLGGSEGEWTFFDPEATISVHRPPCPTTASGGSVLRLQTMDLNRLV